MSSSSEAGRDGVFRPSSTDATQHYRPSDDPSVLAGILDDYLAGLQAGRRPDRAQLVAAYPELGSELEACLAGLEFIHRTGQPTSVPARLGDFRIVREIGRGGMGVVYEAEQLSLRRRVALKVLKVAVGVDSEALDRFRREAETVAVLHHTNIVPIFAVGSEEGVHYFAMQYIEGRSLADVMRGNGAENEISPAVPAVAAGWCLEAAEALAHAHRRGVIHRDVKPSNLLLDNDGRIWLSDFGLARRASEATLTVTGAIMGPPRYMSPEQAGAARLPLDHRTDVYSLGATLYEFAAGRPVFEAATPHAILTKIVGAEPVAPRKINPGLPRDLETIILKCLAKEPGERYQTAQDLSDDLRRFVAGDPIRARRASLWERVRRWIRKRRQSVAISTGVALLAALLAVAAVVGWTHYREAQKGEVSFATSGPHFKAELLDANDVPTGLSFTVPNESPLRIEPGDYKALLTRDGVLSETVQLSVEPAASQKFTLDLSGRDIWEQASIPRNDTKNDGFAFIPSGSRVDLLLTRTQRGLRKLSPRSDRSQNIDNILWEVSWHGWQPWGGENSPGAKGFGYNEATLGILNQRRHLATPAPQLTKKDRIADPVWSGVSGLLAVNGLDGHVLWHHAWQTEPPTADEKPPSKAKPAKSEFATKTTRPIECEVNGDSTPDFLVAVEAPHSTKKTEDGKTIDVRTSRRWVEAVSGVDGKELWRRTFQNGWKPEVVLAEKLPVEFLTTTEGQTLVCLDGPQILFLDPKTGKDRTPPADLGDDSPSQLRPFDVDADGKPDTMLWTAAAGLHALRLTDGKESPGFPKKLDFTPVGDFTLIPGPQPAVLLLKEVATAKLELRRYGWTSDKPDWIRPIRAQWPIAKKEHTWDSLPFRKPTWPTVAERWQRDTHRDVIVPDRFSRTKPEPETESGTIHLDFDDKSQWWAGLSVLDADTGDIRWQRQFPAQADGGRYLQLDHFAAGDDVDGDGFREVYVASFGSSLRESPGYGNYTLRYLYVTCLAGSDGRTLWWWRQRFVDDSSAFIEPLQWWQSGPDGHPLLMVSYNADSSHSSPKSPSATYFLQAATGKVEHVLTGVGDPKVADISGDGIPDLYSLVEPPLKETSFRSEANPQLFAMQGTLPVAWRRLGKWDPIVDINGDGVSDVLWSKRDIKQAEAADGRTGKRLWKTTGVDADLSGGRSFPSVDLDGDGVLDLFSAGPMRREALSLKTGAPLWKFAEGADRDADLKGDAIGISYGGRLVTPPAVLRAWGDDRLAIVYEFQLKFGPTNVNQQDEQTEQRWIAAVEGLTGKLLWRTPLGEKRKGKAEVHAAAIPADLDGDGAEDLVVLTAGDPHWMVRGVRGRDGEVLWTRELSQVTGPTYTLLDEHPVLLVNNRVPSAPRILVVERDCPITSVETKGAGESPIVAIGTIAHQILLLSPKDGVARRVWRGQEAAPLVLKNDQIPWSVRGVLAKFDERGHSLCVSMVRPRDNAENAYHVWNDQIVIGPDDQIASEHSAEVTVAWGSTLVMPSLFAADLDGDGFDELVWGDHPSHGDTLYASHSGFDRERPLWKRDNESDDVVEVIPHADGRDALVVIYGGNSNTFAVNGRTGKKTWTDWPGRRLPATASGEPLRFLATREDLTTCYVGGQSAHSPPLPDASARFHPPPDPRLEMSLPWAGWTEITSALKASLYSLGLLVIPLGLLLQTIRWRSWKWGLAAILWGSSIAFAYYHKWLPGSVHSFEELFAVMAIAQYLEVPLKPLTWVGFKLDLATMRAVSGLPVLGIPCAILLSYRRGKGNGLVGLVVMLLLTSAVVAVVLLKTKSPRFDPHEYYVGTDLPQIVLFGAYYLGLATLAGWILVKLLRTMGRVSRGILHFFRRRTTPSPRA